MTNKQNNKKSNVEKRIETIVNDTKNELLRVSNVARELNLNEKRARSFLRNNSNVAQYNEFRTKTFTRESNAYKTCVELLTQYKKRLSSNVAS